MKPTDENSDKLSERLQGWRVNEKLPPRTADEVWRRIALTQTQSDSALVILLKRIQRAFSRPAFAGMYVAVLVIVGTVAGSLVGSARSERQRDELAARYLASVNPYKNVSVPTSDGHR